MGTGGSTAGPANISTASTTSGRQASTHSETRSALVGWACVDGKASWPAGSRRPWRRAGRPQWASSGAYWRPTRRQSSICWSATHQHAPGMASDYCGWSGLEGDTCPICIPGALVTRRVMRDTKYDTSSWSSWSLRQFNSRNRAAPSTPARSGPLWAIAGADGTSPPGINSGSSTRNRSAVGTVGTSSRQHKLYHPLMDDVIC